YTASPPFTNRTSACRTQLTQRFLSMLGSAVSSSTPKDFQPNSHIGHWGSLPLMKFHARSGPLNGCPYPAVGIHRALQSAIGLPRRSSSALWMLRFLMPADVSRYFMMLLSQLSKMSSVRRTDGGKGIRQGGEVFLLYNVARIVCDADFCR